MVVYSESGPFEANADQIWKCAATKRQALEGWTGAYPCSLKRLNLKRPLCLLRRHVDGAETNHPQRSKPGRPVELIRLVVNKPDIELTRLLTDEVLVLKVGSRPSKYCQHNELYAHYGTLQHRSGDPYAFRAGYCDLDPTFTEAKTANQTSLTACSARQKCDGTGRCQGTGSRLAPNASGWSRSSPDFNAWHGTQTSDAVARRLWHMGTFVPVRARANDLYNMPFATPKVVKPPLQI